MNTKVSRKLVISSLILLSAITLAGSISGTVAWFQYSTRALVAYKGTTAHCSKLLQISVDGGNSWGSDLTSSPLERPTFAPVTTGPRQKNEALPLMPGEVPVYADDGVTPTGETKTIYSPFYAQPDRLQGLYDNWYLASESSYHQFDIYVRVKDVDGSTPEKFLSNEVFLTDLTIADGDLTDDVDLSSAVRVHISTKSDGVEKNFLFAKEVEETEVGGLLDIDGQEGYDYYGYAFDKQTCVYGGGTLVPATYDDEGNLLTEETVKDVPVQTSYLCNDTSIIADDDNGIITGGTSLGSTSVVAGEYLKITVTIWLEGWSPLLKQSIGSETSVWDENAYIEQTFNVGMTFNVKLHADQE